MGLELQNLWKFVKPHQVINPGIYHAVNCLRAMKSDYVLCE